MASNPWTTIQQSSTHGLEAAVPFTSPACPVDVQCSRRIFRDDLGSCFLLNLSQPDLQSPPPPHRHARCQKRDVGPAVLTPISDPCLLRHVDIKRRSRCRSRLFGLDRQADRLTVRISTNGLSVTRPLPVPSYAVAQVLRVLWSFFSLYIIPLSATFSACRASPCCTYQGLGTT